MLDEICRHIRNYFPDIENRIEDTFSIANNTVTPFPNLLSGQYFLIEGSVLNDGIHLNDADLTLADETFKGAVTPLKLPKAFLDLVEEIETASANVKASPYASESFGGYSYSKATTASGNSQSILDAYATRLNAWRKV